MHGNSKACRHRFHVWHHHSAATRCAYSQFAGRGLPDLSRAMPPRIGESGSRTQVNSKFFRPIRWFSARSEQSVSLARGHRPKQRGPFSPAVLARWAGRVPAPALLRSLAMVCENAQRCAAALVTTAQARPLIAWQAASSDARQAVASRDDGKSSRALR